MPLAETDLASVEQWVEQLNSSMPPHVASQLRYQTEVYRNAVTLVECRAPDAGKTDGDSYRMPFARLRFTRSRGWQLYWADRNSEFHIYDPLPPLPAVDRLLREISDDPTCIFFG